MVGRLLIGGLVIAVAMGAFALLTRTERDWRQAALDDVDFMYEVLRDGHPGPVDQNNPGFAELLDRQYTLARTWAEQADTPAGHFYAKRGFTAGFQDVHLADQLYAVPQRTRRWPGFAVHLDETGATTVFMSETENAPAIGAEIISCDGRTPSEMFATWIAPFFHWSWLTSSRSADWPYLLIDSANPFVDLAQTCVFATGGVREAVTLEWLPLADDTMTAIIADVDPDLEQTTELRFLDNQIAWISVASFGDSEPAVAERLDTLNHAILARHDAITAAPALVLDVRANLGGASAAGARLAAALWGADFIADHRPRHTSTDWRASQFNLDQINTIASQVEAGLGRDSEIYAEIATIRDGIQASVEAEEAYFEVEQPHPTQTGAQANALPARIFLLTDQTCISACLDFVDLIMGLPDVTQIGRETGGDTLYLEVVFAELPSRTGRIAYPGAVHRGRARGVNETWTPSEVWPGDITDTASLEAWVTMLADELASLEAP